MSEHVTNMHGLLANVNAYRTLTVEQPAFISSENRAMSPQAHLVRDMFTLGLVDIGTYQRPMGAPPHAHRTKLIRPSRSAAFHDLFLPHMTYPEWATTTGAHPWMATSRYDRHNVLVAQIIARAAEFLPIGAVVGERFADVANLAYRASATSYLEDCNAQQTRFSSAKMEPASRSSSPRPPVRISRTRSRSGCSCSVTADGTTRAFTS